MAKFDKKPGSGRDRPRRPAGNRVNKPGFSGEKEEGSKKNYKTTRSFTKNKSFRDGKETKGDKPYRPFDRDKTKPYDSKFKKEGARPFSDKPRRAFKDGENTERARFNKEDGFKREGADRFENKPRKSFRDGESTNSERPKRTSDFKRDDNNSERPKRTGDFKKSSGKPFGDRAERGKYDATKPGDKKPRFNKREAIAGKRSDREEGKDTKRVKYGDFEEGNVFSGADKKQGFRDRKPAKINSGPPKKTSPDDGLTRLNKYLSNAGIASRREADILIQGGTVKVNGVVVDQLGYKIKEGDKVTYGDAAVKSERKVYLLLNKPKDYITTLDDPQERKTVMELIKGACKERVYPVGRLDRNTTGLLLFTNDGEITTRLTHPKFGVKKIYHVSLNKGLKPDDFKAIIEGVELEDGLVNADDLAFVGEGKKEIGIEIHSGRNRIVRRLFEHLGYDVLKLDRVAFAGLTKKELPRGKHRFLTAKEISFLHMIG
jgi:23S rRNA pseudouridine2605 synthase